MLERNIIKEINEKYVNNPLEERLSIAAAIQTEMKKFAKMCIRDSPCSLRLFFAAFRTSLKAVIRQKQRTAQPLCNILDDSRSEPLKWTKEKREKINI